MCSIDGCGSKPVTKSLCAKHYMRLRRTGSATEIKKPGRPKAAAKYTYLGLTIADCTAGAELLTKLPACEIVHGDKGAQCSLGRASP